MESNEALKALSALAQMTRLETFRLLVSREAEGVPAGELARPLATPQNTMSTHLAILSRAGLVRGERRSRSIIARTLNAFGRSTCFCSRSDAGAAPSSADP